MKKQNIKSLKLNKKSISNFQINGGQRPTSANCAPVRSDNNHTCGPIEPNWVSIGGFICWVTN
ncbi:hypothetical protein [uncultured Kordia sp.]|uniref:hypothetical protein n=1 Tax=uncultured Kordia sp. TaxID=507699 RepID=UPI00260C2283|nr:hypothetical protein [uncultured Kordia sp.]